MQSAKSFGIDFGTSNSALAVADADGAVRLARFEIPTTVPLSTTNQSRLASTCPSVLFASTRRAQISAGYDAISHYIETARDGRFIQSMKAFLPKSNFTGTSIGGRVLRLEDLVAEFLDRLIRDAKKSLGVELDGLVTFGRPARFSNDPEEEALAETRFRAAIEAVGVRDYSLLREPTAAALAYESELTTEETVFVVDLGGGTSDFTLMRLGPRYRSKRDDASRVLATGGISVAGDAFDGQIVEACLFEPLGYGSQYRAFTSLTRVPHWIFHKLKRWNHVSFLKERTYLEFLRNVERTSDAPEAIAALLQVVEDDLGYVLFRAVERSKRGLQHESEDESEIFDEDLPVGAALTRKAFREATQDLRDNIEATALEVLASGQVQPAEVDAVFMTGGTSLLPEIQNTFRALFGPEKIRVRDMFTSVVQGLASSGHAQRSRSNL
ncbi:MAG: Hsp70 family protein [Deltaproteobacteria bacterium]|nr:Hsp70 family protein [Deltaproteobacteria bacterium]